MNDRERLVDALRRLSSLRKLGLEQIADTLACTLGPEFAVTEHRTERPLVGSELFTRGMVMQGSQEKKGRGRWVAVSLAPSDELGLALQDLEPFLLDSPYQMDVQMVHYEDGPAIGGLDHLFLVEAGMLAVGVEAASGGSNLESDLRGAYGERFDRAAGTRPGRDLVREITLTNEPRAGLEHAPTLRVFREGAAASTTRE